jgi:prophage maintenance system killer protein
VPEKVRFLTVEHVRRAHEDGMRKLGEEPQPLGSTERLEGALSRIPFSAHYRAATVIELAALTAVAISQAQAFLDGNKRTAEGAMVGFLRLNGYQFQGNGMQVALFLEINAFLSEVPNPGDEPREKGLQAFTLWLESVVVARA